jgi:hypothetical protein
MYRIYILDSNVTICYTKDIAGWAANGIGIAWVEEA